MTTSENPETRASAHPATDSESHLLADGGRGAAFVVEPYDQLATNAELRI
jgi:hypothetical protein